MSPLENGHRLFEVKNSQEVGNQIKAILKKAIARGKGNEFLDAVKKIMEKLRREADTFGEPLYGLPSMGLQMRLGLIGPLSVRYAVNLAAHKVFIAVFKPFWPQA